MRTKDEPDVDILKGTVGIIIGYSIVEFTYKSTISCTIQYSLKCYEIHKHLFQPKVSIIVVSNSVTTKSPLVETILIKDENNKEYSINL